MDEESRSRRVDEAFFQGLSRETRRELGRTPFKKFREIYEYISKAEALFVQEIKTTALRMSLHTNNNRNDGKQNDYSNHKHLNNSSYVENTKYEPNRNNNIRSKNTFQNNNPPHNSSTIKQHNNRGSQKFCDEYGFFGHSTANCRLRQNQGRSNNQGSNKSFHNNTKNNSFSFNKSRQNNNSPKDKSSFYDSNPSRLTAIPQITKTDSLTSSENPSSLLALQEPMPSPSYYSHSFLLEKLVFKESIVRIPKLLKIPDKKLNLSFIYL